MYRARTATPTAEPEDAWREKQRQLAEARVRLLAAKNGEASVPPPSPTAPQSPAPSPPAPLAASAEPAPERSPREASAVSKLISEIAAGLGETGSAARHGIYVLLKRQGDAFVHEHVAKARGVEASGGMLTLDGQRRRTLGGVFFFLAKKTVGEEAWCQMFPLPSKRRPHSTRSPSSPAPALPTPTAPPTASTKTTQPGEARTVKVTLIGRPDPVEVRDTFIETTMVNRKAPDLPKGLPAPPKEPTRWRVFIGKKTWARVESALATDPTDMLVVEAWGAFDASVGVMTAYAMNATTVALQRAAKASKPALGAP